LEKSEFPVSPETENSQLLKGDKNVITVRTADHVACFVIEWFVLKYNPDKRNFSISWLKDEQVEEHFLKKRGHTSADWRSGIQLCVWRRAEDLSDLEFQNML